MKCIKKNKCTEPLCFNSRCCLYEDLVAVGFYPKNVNNRKYRKANSPLISKRASVLVDNGHKRECAVCERKSDLTFDHIIPLSKGGKDCNSNGQVLCFKCNTTKSDLLITNEELLNLINK
ncbi:HNH endonuclease [Tenacibaculum sp. 47A_GOM-205m]|uniref:HNH endonuclease n=1 Tax=Tenacibaculum sp. 47A_GOM-205m TaxID=1380384 RepID=UPI0004B4BCAC|nr:HNH endonuclease [Tenacibaculum sp. 47A_GOM-205m]